MPVQDLYYKKYLKYKNKYLELKQYGGGPLEEAKARIKDRVREDEENKKLINTCKEFFVWPTSKVASQRKEDDEYVAKNDKIENNRKRLEEMEKEDNIKNKFDLLFSHYVDNMLDKYSHDPDTPKTVKSKIIDTGEINFAEFNNYLTAVRYVRENYDTKDTYTDSFIDHTKWLIIDNGTNAVVNRDDFYYTRNNGKLDTDDFYKVNFQPNQYSDGSDSDGYKSD